MRDGDPAGPLPVAAAAVAPAAMRRSAAMLGVAAMMLGAIGVFSADAADDRRARYLPDPPRVTSVADRSGGVRFVLRQRVYGRPEYRCRPFSFNCSWTRPFVYSHQYVSFGNRPNGGSRSAPSRARRADRAFRPRTAPRRAPMITSATPPSGPVTQPDGPRTFQYEGRRVTVLDRSGGFARIEAPGNATRWVRASVLSPVK